MRRAISVLGEILVTIGVLVLLFVAWQLWWTDVAADQAQHDHVAQLERAFQAAEPASSVKGVRPGSQQVDKAVETEGTAFAVLRVPRFGGDYARPIVEGVGHTDLTEGIGHEPGSALPGDVGNFATAGHRVTYGKPYHRIDELRRGDAIVVETVDGWAIYRMQRHRIVDPSQGEVYAPVPDNPGAHPQEAWMTLVACHPPYTAESRWVAYARLERFVARTRGARPAVVAAALAPVKES